MKLNSRRLWSASILSLGLVMGATACTGGSSPGSHDLNAAGGQDSPAHTLDNLAHSVEVYSDEFVSKTGDEQAEKSESEKVHSYFTEDVDPAQRDSLVQVFLMTAQIPGDVKVEFDPNDIEVTGESAIVRGNDIRLTVDGKRQESQSEGGSITLKSQSGKWLISGVESPDGEPATDEYTESAEEPTNG